MLDTYAMLELIRTDPAPQPCRACGNLTVDVWALTQSDAARLYYAEYRACSSTCAESLAQEATVPA
jgi:hypothetical protein